MLSDDIEYLAGLVGGPNLPFNSLASGTTNLSESNNQWLIRHRHQYLHYKVRLTTNDNDDLDLFYNGIRVYHDGTGRGAQYTYSGYVDLNDPDSWSDWSGTYDGGTTYAAHDVVLHSGVYYASKTNGNEGNTPPNGTHWNVLGAAGAFATVGTLYQLYVDTNLQNGGEVTVDYLIEAEGTTL